MRLEGEREPPSRQAPRGSSANGLRGGGVVSWACARWQELGALGAPDVPSQKYHITCLLHPTSHPYMSSIPRPSKCSAILSGEHVTLDLTLSQSSLPQPASWTPGAPLASPFSHPTPQVPSQRHHGVCVWPLHPLGQGHADLGVAFQSSTSKWTDLKSNGH